jgi:hypothetical protein
VNIEFATIADRATPDPSGKVNMLGAGIGVISSPEFPAPLNATLVAGFAYNSTEAGRERVVTVELVDEDGNRIIDPMPQTVTPAPPLPGIRGGLLMTFGIVEIIGPQILPKPGVYSFEITLDGNHVKSVPFQVLDTSEAQKAA